MVGKETIIECLQEHVEKRGGALYMTQPMGGGAGEIKTWTFQEAWEEATRMAAFLKAKDLPPGSSIALCSKNCAWWIMADLAIWLAGHVSVPIYPTLTADTTQFILEHSEAKLLFVGKLDKHPWDEMKKGVPASMPTVSFPLCPGAEGDYGDTWADITAKTEPLPLKEIANRKPEEMATIIYTSGSTGRPKGVMISFKTMKVTTNGIVKLLKATSKDRELSYLPLAHGMARWTDECIPWGKYYSFTVLILYCFTYLFSSFLHW
jgi:long-chain acyl-CoA synthetase